MFRVSPRRAEVPRGQDSDKQTCRGGAGRGGARRGGVETGGACMPAARPTKGEEKEGRQRNELDGFKVDGLEEFEVVEGGKSKQQECRAKTRKQLK